MRKILATAALALGMTFGTAGLAAADGLSALPGPVGVPANYVYDPSLGSLHDYCTSSEDQALLDNRNLDRATADFRGSCAIHDMCYEAQMGKDGCDTRFHQDLYQQCMYQFGSDTSGFREACLNRADLYYQAVKLFGNP